jgi:hypothetical protein
MCFKDNPSSTLQVKQSTVKTRINQSWTPPSALCTPRMCHARGDGTEASNATAPHPGVRGTYSTECANVAGTLLAQRGFVRLTLLNGSNTIDLQ